MKNNIFLILATLFLKTAISQTIIYNPTYEKTTHDKLKIRNIALYEDKTVIEFYIYADEGWFCIDKAYFIYGLNNGEKYELQKSEGTPICPESHKFKGDSLTFKLYFPPIDKENNYINLDEGCENACVKIEKILINNQIHLIDKAYNEADDYYHEGNFEKSLEIALKILPTIKDTLSLRYGQLSLIIADSYLWSKDYNKAEVEYHKILNSNLVDSVQTGILGFPFANFKNKACQGLAYVFEYRGNWDKSLEWLNKEKQYAFYTYSNTHRLKHEIHLLEWYVFLYEKKGSYDKAVHENLQFIITQFGSGIRNKLYNKANQRLVKLVDEHYDRYDFRQQLDSALNQMIITESDSVVSAEFKFLNHDYTVQVFLNQKDYNTDENYRIIIGSEIKKKNNEYFINRIKNQLFYERIQLMSGQSLTRNGDLTYYKDKPYTGEFYEFWANGNNRTKGEVQNGVFEGEFIFYYENGNVKELGKMINGLNNELWIRYYDNGAVEAEGKFVDNKKNGEWIFWYPSGKQNVPLEMSGFTLNATLDEELPKQKKAEIEYSNDIENGLLTIWYENGQIFRKGEYIQGKRTGAWTEWSENGEVVKQAKYKKGELIKGDVFDNE